MLHTAVIIAGGEGSRLKPLSNNKPKAMVEINGRPMLYWALRWLKFHGVKNVVIGVAYKKGKILSAAKNIFDSRNLTSIKAVWDDRKWIGGV